MTSSPDLAAFIAARLDEDEQVARVASPGPWVAKVYADYPDTMLIEDVDGESMAHNGDGYRSWPDGNREHIAHFNPKRALDDIESKRRVVEHCVERLRDWPAERHDSEDRVTAVDDLMAVLKGLALPYSGHPDYQEGWRL